MTQQQSSNELQSLFRAARFAYVIGVPIMDDHEYDSLRFKLEKEYPDTPELYQVQEMDDFSFEELTAHGVQPFMITEYVSKKGITREFDYADSKDLLALDNRSIKARVTIEDEIGQIMTSNIVTADYSAKVDGIYISTIYERSKDKSNLFIFKSAQTRGGETDAIDVTQNIKYLVRNTLELPDWVTDNAVKFSFDAIYDGSFTRYANQKSGAQGVITSLKNPKPEEYSHVRLIAHNVSLHLSYVEKYKFIASLGFETVHSGVVSFTKDATQITEQIKLISKLVKDWSTEQNIDVDGVVIHQRDYDGDQLGKSGNKIYDADTFACKSEFWVRGEYISTVVGIEAEQQDSDISYKICFEPVTTDTDNKSLSVVSNIRLATLLLNDIKPGTKIRISYVNNTTPRYEGVVPA